MDETCRLTSVATTIILVPLLSRILAQSGFHLLLVTTDVYAESKLLPQDLLQRASVSDVDPLALSGALLVVHALTLDRPVEALGSGQRRREPNLLVGGLLVEYVGSVGRKGDVQDAGLHNVSCWISVCARPAQLTHRVVDFHILSTLLHLLCLFVNLLQESIRQSVELLVGDFGRRQGRRKRLALRCARVLGIRHQASSLRYADRETS